MNEKKNPKTSKTTTTTKKRTTKQTKTTSPKTTKKVEEKKITPPVIEPPKKVEDTIDPKSILSIITILLAAILLAIYMVTLFMRVRETNYSKYWEQKSYLVEKEISPQVSCDKLSNAILGSQAFIYVTSYNEEEFELEKDLAKIIQKNKIGSDFYVYPLEDACGSINSVESVVSENLKLTQGINKVPAILYYRNGELKEIVTREDEKMLEAGDFQKLLDMYEIAIEE